MKYNLLLLFLISATCAVGQDSWDSLGELPKVTAIQTISPYDSVDQFEDLMFLKEVLKDKRIVMLGESLHGVEDFNEAKTRMIKFLHQEMDFEVVAFESELSSCELANNKKENWSVDDLLKYSIYKIWHTPANWELMDYIKNTANLQLSGFDMQPEFFEDSTCLLYEFFKPAHPSLAKKVLSAEQELQNCCENESERDEFKKKYQSFLDKLENSSRIAKNYEQKAIELVKHAIKYRIDVLDRYVLIQGNIEELLKASKTRDSIMAKNVEWLLDEYYPNKKIIIWAHNSHISKGGSASGHGSMGEILQGKFAKESYVMGFYYAIGEVCHMPSEMIRYENTLESIQGNSIQYMIYKLNAPLGFIDFREQKDNKWLSSRLHNVYLPFSLTDEESRIRLIDNYDGIFMTRKARYPDYLEGVKDFYLKK